jgi:hypothetical protein
VLRSGLLQSEVQEAALLPPPESLLQAGLLRADLLRACLRTDLLRRPGLRAELLRPADLLRS